MQQRVLIAVAACMVCACLSAIAMMIMTSGTATTSTPRQTSSSPSGPSSVSGLSPSKFVAFGRTHYYQIPTNPKGLVVHLPGCARFNKGFWPASSSAPECYGMPEEVSHTKQVLRKGYAMLVPLAISSTGCFTHSSGDDAQLPSIIANFISQHGLGGKPVYMMGASAGGGMIQGLVQGTLPFKVSGLVSEVESHAPIKSTTFPPIVYVVMERDTGSQTTAASQVAMLRGRGSPAAWITSPKRVIYPLYFSDLCVSISPQMSQQIVETLRSSGLIDVSGNLVSDPHPNVYKGTWKQAVAKLGVQIMNFDTSPVMQALVFAYAAHESVANYTTAALTWFEGGCKADFATLAASLAVDKPASFSV